MASVRATERRRHQPVRTWLLTIEITRESGSRPPVMCSWDIIDDAMPLELEELRARSTLLSAALGDDEALEVNEAILDLDPGDPVATNRLGIGLINRRRYQQAVEGSRLVCGCIPTIRSWQSAWRRRARL